MARKILCVAEKPAIARAVATHLSGGSFQTVSTQEPSWIPTNFDSTPFVAIHMSKTTNLNSILGAPGETVLSP